MEGEIVVVNDPGSQEFTSGREVDWEGFVGMTKYKPRPSIFLGKILSVNPKIAPQAKLHVISHKLCLPPSHTQVHT